MDSVLNQTATTKQLLDAMDRVVDYRRCGRCRQAIDINLPFKTCNACRAKNKVKRERMRLKIKEMQTTAVLARTDVHNRKCDTTGASMKGENACSSTQRDESRKVVEGDTRGAQKSLYELEGEERKVAMKMMKASLKPIIRRHGKKPLPIATVKSATNVQDYQTASSLYDALKSKALSSYPASNEGTQFLQFHGSHTIVAVSSINNTKRIYLVAKDLRKIARLSFELGDAMVLPDPSAPGSATLSYPCNCLGHTRAVAPPGPQKSNGPGFLVRWARAGFASTASQAVPRMCGGKVNVTVLDDNTHPLNILGQQIIVCVEHRNV
ncbi:hypothetical protein BYT27DRAFT_7161397 [Phlegmacium glaucopus]|nr:hypothetical protein BYT27DRAFT_7161397 [Phlegmacium glaucopus]